MKRILITTTSFQDTPGEHHEILKRKGYEIVAERGPLPESKMLELVTQGDFDGILCGDDAYTRQVLEKCIPRLRVLAKYGIGLDKIDLKAATEFKIPVTFTPSVNHVTVAEHTFALILALYRHLVSSCNHVKRGEWKRMTGHELHGKTIGIVGMGRIGKEVAIRARSFGLTVLGFDVYWAEDFAKQHHVERVNTVNEMLKRSDIISLHTNLTDETRGLINAKTIGEMKKNAILINCARGELVDTTAIVEALKSDRIMGYGTDVLDEEPPPANHPLFACDNAILTPHIGSRTYESVARQAKMAVENLVAVLDGQKPHAQANLNS